MIDLDIQGGGQQGLSRFWRSGVELELQWMPMATLDLRAQVTYTDIDLKDGATRLLGRLGWRSGANALWQLPAATGTIILCPLS